MPYTRYFVEVRSSSLWLSLELLLDFLCDILYRRSPSGRTNLWTRPAQVYMLTSKRQHGVVGLHLIISRSRFEVPSAVVIASLPVGELPRQVCALPSAFRIELDQGENPFTYAIAEANAGPLKIWKSRAVMPSFKLRF